VDEIDNDVAADASARLGGVRAEQCWAIVVYETPEDIIRSL